MYATRLMTAVELLHMPGHRWHELVRGELRPLTPAGRLHGNLRARLGARLLFAVEEADLGEVHVETGFVLQHQPDTVRAPDVAFISNARLLGQDDECFFEGAPDLAVEFVSPSETADDVQEKVKLYLATGVRLVWLFYTHRRSVMVHRADGSGQLRCEADTLDGEDVLPGFKLSLVEFFAKSRRSARP